MSSIKELSKQLVAPSGVANMMDARVGRFLDKWFCSFPWAQRQLKVCHAELGPQVRAAACRAAVADFAEHLLTPTAVVSLVLDMRACRVGFRCLSKLVAL